MAGTARRRGSGRRRPPLARSLVGAALALSLAPPSASAHEDRADTLARLDHAIADAPHEPELWRSRAAIERRRGRYPRAHEDLARAVSLGLDPALAARERGLLWLAEGRPADAERALRAACEGAPGDLSAQLAHARALAALARWTEAADAYGRVVEQAPHASPDVHLERVRAIEAQGAGALDAAIAAADAAIAAIGPAPALVQAALALELRAGRVDAALARLDRAAAGRARRESVLLQRAELLERAGRPDEAAASYAAALAALQEASPTRGPTPASRALEAQARDGIARLAKGAAR